MSKYLLDTGILLGYIRAADYAKSVEKKYKLMAPASFTFVSIVSIGEMYSLAEQFQWGVKKKNELERVLNEIQVIDINHRVVLEKYAEIDAFSQGKHRSRALPKGMSARNMGKNDLWIAASASVLNAKLLTTDKDFEHLDGEFLEVIFVDPKSSFE